MNSSELLLPPRSRPHGWTLIELLVVIAIVSVLVAITIGVTGGIQNKTKEAQCIQNLRQLSSAFHHYTQDYNRGVIKSQISGGSLETGWTRLIVNKGYLPGHTPWKVLCCPTGNMSDSAKQSTLRYNPRSPSLAAGDAWRWQTYGLNACIIPNVAIVRDAEEENSGRACRIFELPLAKISQASRHVLLADSSYGPPDENQRQSMERSNKGGPSLRHGPKGARYAHALFVDGHVEALTREQIIALGDGFRIPPQWIFESD